MKTPTLSGKFLAWLSACAFLASLSLPGLRADTPPLTINQNHFETGDGTPVRFWGINLVAMYPTHAESEGIAANLASREINMVRLHHNLRSSLDWNTVSGIPALVTYVNDTRTPHTEAWDRFDYLNAQLRTKGIYTLLSLHSSRRFLAGDVDILTTDATDRTNWMNAMTALNSMPGNLDLFKVLPMFDERCALLMEEFAQRLVTHVNPYTGTAYGADSQVLYIEMMNEHSSEYAIVAGNKFQSSTYPAVSYFTTKLQAKWDAYTAANGVTPCDIYAPSTNPQKLARSDFLRGIDEAYANRMRTFVRNLGCQTPMGFSNLWRGEAFQKLEESHSDVVEEHNYADPLIPRTFNDAFNYFTRSTPVGKPYFVGELNQDTTDTAITANAPYRATMQLAASAYGSFNDWSGLAWFAWSHGDKMVGNDGWSIWEERRPSNSDLIGQIESDGVMLDHLRTAGLIFRRGLVTPSVQPQTLYADDPLAATGYTGMMTPKYQFQAGWQNVYAIKRAFGPVPPSQLTAPWMTTAPANPLVSDTGQIRKDTTRQQLTLSAPQAEAFSGKLDASAPAGLGHLGIGATSGSATVILVANDALPFATSGNLIISRTYFDNANAEVANPVTTIAGLQMPSGGNVWHIKRTRPRGETGYEALTMTGGVLTLPSDGWHEAELLYAPTGSLPARQSLAQIGDVLRPIFDDAYRVAGVFGPAQGGFSVNAQGVIDPSTTFTPAEGSKSLRIKFTAGLDPCLLGINFTNSAIQATPLDLSAWKTTHGLRFWVYTKRVVSSFSVELVSSNGTQLVESRLPLSNYLAPSDYGNKWVQITVPFSDFPVTDTAGNPLLWNQVKGIGFYCSTVTDGYYDPYVDNVRIVRTVGEPVPPAAPTGVSAVGGTGQISLSWSETPGAGSYHVKRATTSGGPFTTVASPTLTSYTDTTVTNGTLYYYVISAVNSFGESPDSTAATATAQAVPSAPAGLSAVAGNAQVTLSWSASSGATSYSVKRGTVSGGPYTSIGTPATTGFVDATAANGTTYYYVVSAVNSAGESASSNAASATPQAPLTAPAGLAATGGNAQVGLSWTAVSGATGYNVKRATTSGGAYTTITSPAAASYTDTTVSNGTTYYYVVSAVNSTTESANSAETSATPAAGSAQPTTVTLVSIGAEDGFVQESSATSNIGGSYNSTDAGSAALTIGDTNSNRQNKLIVSFDTSSIPATATITSATLKLKRGALVGTNPFTTLGACSVDLKGSTGFGGATALAAGDFQAAADVTQVATMSNPVNNGDWSTGDFTAAGLSAIDRTGKTQLRVAFALGDNGNGSNDYAGFYSGDNTTAANRPVLVVTYQTAENESAVPVITSAPEAGGAYGAPFNYTITSSQPATQFSATDLPAGLTLDPATGIISGTPTAAGNYTITLNAVNAHGAATSTLLLTVEKIPATVALAGLTAAYDGATKSVGAITNPAGLPVVFTYQGSASAPINAGSYDVVATINDANYTGTANGAFTIVKATAAIALGNLKQAYDGTGKTVAATTTPADLPVAFTYDGGPTAPVYPGAHTVLATVNSANHTASVAGSLVITVTALVRHAPVLNGDIDGSAQVLLPENTTFNSGAMIAQDLLVPGTPAVQRNGSPIFGDTHDGPGAESPANYTVTLNGGSVLRYLVRRIDPVALPSIAAPAAPAGTRSVSLNQSGDSAGDFATLRDLTLNSNVGAVAVLPGMYGNLTANTGSSLVLGVAGATEPAVYNLQTLTLNSGSGLQIVGPVILTLAHGVNFNATAGAPDHPDWLTLQVASGDVTLNSGVVFYGSVVAPNGTVTINGNSVLHGTVTADRLSLNGNGLLTER